MTNYQHGDVNGEAWMRAYEVRIDNPMGYPKYATFSEERVIHIAGDFIRQPAGQCRIALDADNLGETFDLLHPETGVKLGTSTYGQVQLALYSLYSHAAAKRDAQAAEDAKNQEQKDGTA